MNEKFFTIDDEIYPECLKQIYNPPTKLYYKGNLELLKSERMVAVVGTRNATAYGKLTCEQLASKMAKANVTLVSGFARGIDSIAHNAIIKAGGKTIAVVGTGLDIVYPASNLKLFRELEENHLILSEYEDGTRGFAANFPQRNRIIAGLTRATIVVESKESGGSLITANLALDSNRDIYAVPGDIFSDFSRGCNNLIRDCKAKLLTNFDDILNDYEWAMTDETEEYKNFTEIQKMILRCLSSEKNLDNILNESKLEESEVLAQLMLLEIMGAIKSISGGRYKKIL